ncbi:MAG: hypothetical protein ACRDAP_03685, partial [Shewanella sp.]
MMKRPVLKYVVIGLLLIGLTVNQSISEASVNYQQVAGVTLAQQTQAEVKVMEKAIVKAEKAMVKAEKAQTKALAKATKARAKADEAMAAKVQAETQAQSQATKA